MHYGMVSVNKLTDRIEINITVALNKYKEEIATLLLQCQQYYSQIHCISYYQFMPQGGSLRQYEITNGYKHWSTNHVTGKKGKKRGVVKCTHCQ